MEKTVKIRAYTGEAKDDASQGNPAEDRKAPLELEKKNAQLEEEKQKSLEHLKTIVQLRESLKLEQAKSADLEAKLNKLVTLEEDQLAKKSAQLEEERKRSLEYMRTIEQLKESIKQEQEKSPEMTKKVAELEAKVKDLSGALSKISSIAAAGMQAGN